MRLYLIIKRILDIIFALLLLIVTSPIMLIAAIAILLDSKGPIIFVQSRPGKNGRIFKLYKFRTMRAVTEINNELANDMDRVTKVGHFLRKTSTDELPQIINILTGTMSFIGPRPLLVKYLSYYTEQEMLRHSVLPGITGWAQVNGRNTISWEEKLKYDLEYVNNVSFSLDFRIFLLTIYKILKKVDITNDNYLDFDMERKANNQVLEGSRTD